MVVKNAVLLGRAQPREQRQHLGMAKHRLVAQMFAQVVGRLADLALAGQEHQDVAVVWQPRRLANRPAAAPDFIDRVGNGVVEVVVARFLERPVTLLHREHAPRHHDDRCSDQWPADALCSRTGRAAGSEMVRKALRVNRGGCDDDFQVGSARQYLAQVTEQKVDVQAAFVRLVNDDGVVSL